MAKVTDMEWKGDLLIACKLDGIQVWYVDKDWSVQDTFKTLGATTSGGVFLSLIFPPLAIPAAIVGCVASLWQKAEDGETGYYDAKKICRYTGAIYRNQLT